MPVQQQIFSLIVSVFVFVVVVDMVRKRRLREEYSVLWLATSVILFVLVLRYDWLVTLTTLIGAGLPTTTLFLCALIFHQDIPADQSGEKSQPGKRPYQSRN